MASRLMILGLALLIVALALYLLPHVPYLSSERPVDPKDPRVVAAIDHLRSSSSTNDWLISHSTVVQAWVSEPADGFRVKIGVDSGRYSWLLSVDFDSSDHPTTDAIAAWTGRILPGFLTRLAATSGVMLVVCFGIAPYVFGLKCPDCTNRFFLPTLTHAHDRTVYAGGMDDAGFGLAPVVEKAYVCPNCGYRKITYCVPGDWRAWLFDRRTLLPRLSPNLFDAYDRLLDKWERERRAYARFHTYEEWKQYFDGLKATEREERPPRSPTT